MQYKLITPHVQLEVKSIATLFYMEYDKNFSFAGEKHDFWELVYCDRGEVYIIRGEEELVLRKGMIAFHEPGEFHAVVANRKVSPSLIIISFECENPAILNLSKKLFTLDDNEQKLLAKVLTEAQSAYDINQSQRAISLVPKPDAPFAAEQYTFAQLEIFLIEVIRRQIQMPDREARTKGIQRSNVNTMYENLTQSIIKYLEDHVCQTIRLDDLCSRISLSRSYASYIFKQQTGMSILTYHSQLRMKYAKELIRNKDYNFTQISEMLGYSTAHYFSRRFTKAVGMTPSEYAASIMRTIEMIDSSKV